LKKGIDYSRVTTIRVCGLTHVLNFAEKHGLRREQVEISQTIRS